MTNKTIKGTGELVLDIYDGAHNRFNVETILSFGYEIQPEIPASTRPGEGEPAEAAQVDITWIKAIDRLPGKPDGWSEEWSKEKLAALVWDDPDTLEILEEEAKELEGIEP